MNNLHTPHTKVKPNHYDPQHTPHKPTKHNEKSGSIQLAWPCTVNEKAGPTAHHQRDQARQTPQKKLSSHPYHLFIAHFGACNLTVEASSTDLHTENMTRP